MPYHLAHVQRHTDASARPIIQRQCRLRTSPELRKRLRTPAKRRAVFSNNIDSLKMSEQLPDSFEDILNYHSADFSEIRVWLINQIDHLMHYDMERLKWVLYRIDINEKKLANLLKENTEEVAASEIIADEIIKRQLEKFESRKNTEKGEWSFDV